MYEFPRLSGLHSTQPVSDVVLEAWRDLSRFVADTRSAEDVARLKAEADVYADWCRNGGQGAV